MGGIVAICCHHFFVSFQVTEHVPFPARKHGLTEFIVLMTSRSAPVETVFGPMVYDGCSEVCIIDIDGGGGKKPCRVLLGEVGNTAAMLSLQEGREQAITIAGGVLNVQHIPSSVL